MSSPARTATLRLPSDAPPLAWWLLLVAVVLLATLASWVAAIAVLGMALLQRWRPFDFLTAYLMTLAVGSFINYGNHELTTQMWFLTMFIVFTLFCYVLARRWDSLVLPQSPATAPLLWFFALTFVNFLRGIVIGNDPRFAGLELIANLSLTSCLLVANKRFTAYELRLALIGLWLLCVAHFFRGVWIFSINHVRGSGSYFTPMPGLVAMILLNFALREAKQRNAMLWMVALAPLLAQQVLSFTRGFWMGLIGAIAFSLILFVGRGPGVRARFQRSAVVLGVLLLMAAVGIVVLGAGLGIGGIWDMLGSRFTSSAGTDVDSWQTGSNIVRLNEAVHVLADIGRSPLFGHGLGYAFVIRDVISQSLWYQWYVHENYLLVTLKQGILGLVLWIWLMVAILRTALRGRSLANVTAQSWCTGFAAAVVYVLIYMLVHFPLAETNTTFTFALGIGITMQLTSTDTWAVRWKGRRNLPEAG